jgi:hypothetical protein
VVREATAVSRNAGGVADLKIEARTKAPGANCGFLQGASTRSTPVALGIW